MKIILFMLFLLQNILFCQWIPTTKFGNPSISNLYLDSNFIIAGDNIESKVYFSTDNALTWYYSFQNLPKGYFPINTIKCFNDSYYVGTRGKGIFKSNNLNNSWTDITSNLYDFSNINTVSIDNIAFFNSTLIISTGILYSYYSNENIWKPLTKNGINIRCDFLDTDIYGRIYSLYKSQSNNHILYVSDDSLVSWQEIYCDFSNVFDFKIENNYLIIATDKGLLKSSCDSINFEKINFNSETLLPMKIFAHNDKILLSTTNNRIFYSKNEGENWDEITNNFNSIKINDVAFSDEYFYLATDKGVFKSDIDNINWVESNKHLIGSQIINVKESNSNIYALTPNQGIYYTNNAGDTWMHINNVPNISNLRDFAIKDSIILANNFTNYNISFDNGKTWNSSSNIEQNKMINFYKFIGNKILAGSNNGLYLYESIKGDWSNIENNWKLVLDSTIIKRIYQKNDTTYLCTNYGLYRSWGDLISWSNIENRFAKDTLKNGFIYGETLNNIVVDNNIYIVNDLDVGVYISYDYGANWEFLTDKFRDLNINFYFDNNVLAVFSTQGIWVSYDMGSTWIEFNDGIEDKKYNSDYAICNETLYVETATDGIFKRALKELITSVESSPIIYSFLPHPLPASNEVKTLVYWTINYPLNVENIKIYNIAGEYINTEDEISLELINQYSGYLNWNCSKHIAGIYIIVIKYGRFTKSIKIVKR